MRHTISLFCLLALFWLINSGTQHFTVLMLSLGLLSVIIVLYISHRMDLVDHESQPIHLTRHMPAYIFWLMLEIVKSNIDVLRCIWSIKPAISPCFFTVKASQKTDMAIVIYANSITLTPGTVTVNIDKDILTIHALTKESATALQSGIMDKRVCSIESQ